VHIIATLAVTMQTHGDRGSKVPEGSGDKDVRDFREALVKVAVDFHDLFVLLHHLLCTFSSVQFSSVSFSSVVHLFSPT
jgi:hypothetical protein